MTYLVINAFESSGVNAVHLAAAALAELVVGDVTVDVNGVADFRDAILARPVGDITRLCIYSHGSAGRIALRTSGYTQSLSERTLWMLTEAGDLSDRFATGAEIEILGCNVAGHTNTPFVVDWLGRGRFGDWSFHLAEESAQSEMFIAHLAEILLRRNGGTVTAYTGYGVSRLGHPDGHTVTVHHWVGLGSFFTSAVVLQETAIRFALNCVAEVSLAGVTARDWLGEGSNERIAAEIEQHFNNALSLIGSVGGDGQHTCEHVYEAFTEYRAGARLVQEQLSAG